MSVMALAEAPAELTDESLAAAARAGDRRAFAELVSRYRGIAFSYAFVRLRSREEAEDITQEAFVRAFVAVNQFRVDGTWGAWMMRIVRNLCTDSLRRGSRRHPGDLSVDHPDSAPSPEMLALAGVDRAALCTAVSELPDKYRLPLLLHYAARRTRREIALALNVPESTVVGRLAGALRILRRRLGDFA